MSTVSLPVALLLAAVSWAVYRLFLSPRFGSLHDIPGPPSASFIYGNLDRLIKEEPGVSERAWADEYGRVIRFESALGESRLTFTDPAALMHVLVARCYDYPKPRETFGFLRKYLGKGILFAEGDDHRRQKKVIAPAFAPSALREVTPTFFEKAYRLRDLWTALVEKDTIDAGAFKSLDHLETYKNSRSGCPEIVIEVYKWMSRVTLDIIGATGLSYEFNALDEKSTPLGDAFAKMHSSSVQPPSLLMLLLLFKFSWVLNLVPSSRIESIKRAFETMDSESAKIVEKKKRDVADGSAGSGDGKDLLTLLIKANDGNAKTRMSDSELRGQIPTFILAGHETTSTSLTWTLWTLARHPEVQETVRKELRVARRKANAEGRDELDSDELNSLKYLDAVCREVLRIESPVTATLRRAAKDDLIPLATPIRGRRSGALLSAIPVRAGQVILINVAASNYNKAVFGDDANEFRPERWLDGSVGNKTSAQGVGVYSQLMTFLAGPRSCIGWRFSLAEMKAILSVLIDTFEFAEREPGLKLRRRSAIVLRPLVVGEEEALGFAMPLRVRLAKKG